jgi:hypothetical protein
MSELDLVIVPHYIVGDSFFSCNILDKSSKKVVARVRETTKKTVEWKLLGDISMRGTSLSVVDALKYIVTAIGRKQGHIGNLKRPVGDWKTGE